MVIVEVAVLYITPEAVVFTVPAVVKFERVVIFCVVFTLQVPGAVPVQVVPVPLPSEVTPVLVIVRPEPITDCPAVTEIPVPFDMVPVAVDWNIPPEPTYKLPCATPLLVVVLNRLDMTLPVTTMGNVPV